MVRVKETMVKVTCHQCSRAFTVPFKQWRCEVEHHRSTKAEPFQGSKYRWVCSSECQEKARAEWGCPQYYRRKEASAGNLAKARAAKQAKETS